MIAHRSFKEKAQLQDILNFNQVSVVMKTESRKLLYSNVPIEEGWFLYSEATFGFTI